MSTLIIAEAGVNHNGSLELAERMVDLAKSCGADIVKFQTGIAESLLSHSAKKAQYQIAATGGDESQLDMLKKLMLTFPQFRQLSNYCKKKGMVFLSTPFDLESIDFLSELDMPFWKIPSGEVTNYPYLVKIAKTGKKVVMSTGMCTMDEITAAVELLRENGCSDLSLLQCNTEYPTPYSDVNLAVMKQLRERFGVPVGYSDHTLGIEIPIAAVAMGASIIEKHFTIDSSMEGPDHRASLEPHQLDQMVRAIRNIEQAIGSGCKAPTASEQKNISCTRKSIVASRRIEAGELFTEENLCCKRPGTGISPMRWNELLGSAAPRSYNEDELIEL